MSDHPLAPTGSRFVVIVDTFLSMSGWRLRHLNAAWVMGGAGSLALGRYLISRNDIRATLAFYISSLAFYYLGNAILLTGSFPSRLILRYGEDRAFRMYETVLALMFINQGLGVGCVGALDLGPAWALPATLPVYSLGVAAFAIGLVVKVWATVIVGVDVYYYRDMFLGRPVSGFVSSGPYKVFANPMYGIGQAHAYGYAILNRSIAGLAATTICHVLIYVFYFSVERPFVRRAYLAPTAA
jgi:protein-S-isoprenylcysteine O-methyltransferase Ste14